MQGRVLFYATPPEYMNKRTLWIPPRWITPIFVCCDVVAFVVQLLGAASTLNTHSDAVQQRGKDIVRVGLSLQILCFGFFLIISFRFHFVAAHFREKGKIGRCIKLLWAINFASTCVFVCLPRLDAVTHTDVAPVPYYLSHGGVLDRDQRIPRHT